MAQEIPESFYLLVHDFGGAYAARASTSEGPLPLTPHEALKDLESVLSNWPAAKWKMLQCNPCKPICGYPVLYDVTKAFTDFLELRERERRAEPIDPNKEHRLTAADYGVGRYR